MVFFFLLRAPSNSPTHHGSVHTGGRAAKQVTWRRRANSPADSSTLHADGGENSDADAKGPESRSRRTLLLCKSTQLQKMDLICPGVPKRSFTCKQGELCATDNEASLHPSTRVVFGINQVVLVLNLSALDCDISIVLR